MISVVKVIWYQIQNDKQKHVSLMLDLLLYRQKVDYPTEILNSQNNLFNYLKANFHITPRSNKKPRIHSQSSNPFQSQWARKFKKVQAKKLVNSNKSKNFYVKLHFGSFKLFSNSKIDFWPFLKLQKMEFGQKNYS